MPKRRRSTEPRRLIGSADIVAAIRWRLSGIPPETVSTLLAEVGAWRERLGGRPVQSDDPGVVAMVLRITLAVPDDRREPWTALCALLAMAAFRRRDVAEFMSAGTEVVLAHRQASRGKQERTADALNDLADGYLDHHPEAEPAAVWKHFADMAGFGIVVDFDSKRDVLTYEPGPGLPLKNISRETFLRRVRRIKERIFRTQPVDVRSAA